MCDRPTNSVRKVQIWNTKNNTQLQEMSFDYAVLAVRMNMKRLVVVLENRLHIHDLKTLKSLMIVHTEPNKKGLCALSPNNDDMEHCLMAYPQGPTTGEVVFYDALNLQIQTIKPAHQAPLAGLVFSLDGKLLASASEKGTVIRVFDTPEGNLLYSFRRGSYPAEIYSLAFSNDSSLIAASSSSGTVHVFKLDETSKRDAEEKGSAGYLSGYMPSSVTDMMDPRSFAQVKLKVAGIATLCALSEDNKQIYVITADGFFYTYEMPETEGECRLVKTSELVTGGAGK